MFATCVFRVEYCSKLKSCKLVNYDLMIHFWYFFADWLLF